MALSPCFETIKSERPDVFAHLVNRQGNPSVLLIQDALRKRSIASHPTLEENCLALLNDLHLSLPANAAEELQEEVNAAQAQALLSIMQELLGEEPAGETQEAPVEAARAGVKRPAMREPGFLVPVGGIQQIAPPPPAPSLVLPPLPLPLPIAPRPQLRRLRRLTVVPADDDAEEAARALID